jgi:hypothetical protein
VILPVFKTGGRQVSCHRCVRLAHASASLIVTDICHRTVSHRKAFRLKMRCMSKKTGMSDSSLWIATIIFLALAAWMYFKR